MLKTLKTIIALSLYVTNPALGNSCEAAKAISAIIAPLAKGEVAALQVQATPALMPELFFNDADGKPIKLSDLRGKTILLNLWATWCAPCRQEMPDLDTLQSILGSKDFEVVTINIDTRNLDKPKQFLSDLVLLKLKFYADPTAKIFQNLKNAGKALGMPTTILIDAEGCELGRMPGPAHWASEDAQALIKATLEQYQSLKK
jgi:thiol-disulfide isomerase/thioredoxin